MFILKYLINYLFINIYLYKPSTYRAFNFRDIIINNYFYLKYNYAIIVSFSNLYTLTVYLPFLSFAALSKTPKINSPCSLLLSSLEIESYVLTNGSEPILVE